MTRLQESLGISDEQVIENLQAAYAFMLVAHDAAIHFQINYRTMPCYNEWAPLTYDGSLSVPAFWERMTDRVLQEMAFLSDKRPTVEDFGHA